MSPSPRLLHLPDPRKEPVRRDAGTYNSDRQDLPRHDSNVYEANIQNSDEEIPAELETSVQVETSLALEKLAELESKAKQPQSRGYWLLRFSLELLIALVIAFSLTWLVKTFVLQPYEVPSGSMEPTIMIGDKILADKVTYMFSSVQRGDIVVFEDITQPGRILVKRVIALSGQIVDLQNGRVIVDGVVLYEPYTYGSLSYPLSTFNDIEITYPYTVPEGYVWVMGDNREHSGDSRYFGPIKEESIEGRILMVYWPPRDISLLM